VRFIEKMQEKDKDLAEPVISIEDNAVRVMTIHASKGLEFPVVFLLDMTKEFNLQDLRNRYAFEEKLGAGIRYMDPETRVLYDTLPFQAIKLAKQNKLLSEEMRKLYVGLTRAEQKLFIVGSYKNKEQMIQTWSEAADHEELVFDPALRLKGRSSLMNWIGYGLIRHPEMQKYLEEEVSTSLLQDSNAQFSISWMNQQTIIEQRQLLAEKELVNLDQQMKEKETVLADSLQKRLAYEYPYQASSQTTSYQSVSEIKRLFEDPDDTQESRLTLESSQTKAASRQFRYTQEQLAEPKFLQKDRQVSAAAVGTATHALLQLLPLEMPTTESINQKLQELVKKRLIDEKVAKKVDVSSIIWFFQTELGQQLIANKENVKREQPFSMLLSADEVFQDYPNQEDELLIHGIVDGYLEEKDHLHIYDFKTDFVLHPDDPAEIDAIVQKYQGQLRLYQQAMTEALNKPVENVFLILLRVKRIININK
jgi:ATP-dependent helicase/nuclease subunit A